MNEPYDFVVIGGGSAGYAAARTAHDLGLRTAVIDGAEELGGLCILRGCMPSKSLIESSDRFRAIRHSAEFGLHVTGAVAHVHEIIARKRVLIEDFASYRRDQLESPRFDLHRGTAAFVDEHTLEITPRDTAQAAYQLGFRTALIATGSTVQRVPVEGLEETGYWTSDDILDSEELPDSIVVLGGGAIALEMACYLEGMGREVTVIQRSDQLLTGMDRDVADEVRAGMEARDHLTVHTGTRLLKVGRDADTGLKWVVYEQHGEERTCKAAEILQALGRKPHTEPMSLERAGIQVAASGHVATEDDQRTTREHIFAAGDVAGPHEIVHIAIEQGEIAAHNAALLLGKTSGEIKRIHYRLKLLGIFTDPQVATVGLTEREAKEQNREVVTASYPFNDHGKSMIHGVVHGFVKMIADPHTGEILGAAVVGPEAVELIHEVVVAMYFRSTVENFVKIPHYHPTLSEIWLYPAEDILFPS